MAETGEETVGRVHHPQRWREGCKEEAKYTGQGAHKGGNTVSEAIRKKDTEWC